IDIEGDVDKNESTITIIVTSQTALKEPCYPSLPGIMQAKKKTLEELELDDLDLDEEDVEAKTETIERFLPAEKAAGRILEGEIDDQVKELVSVLKTEAKVL